MEERPLPMPREPGQRDQKLPQVVPWKFFCLAMTLILLLLVIIFGVALAKVLELTTQLQDELNQLNKEFVQGLADARHHQDLIRGEMFRLMEAVQAGNGSTCKACPNEWSTFEGSCYYFSTDELNWYDANDDCTHQGAHLVISSSQAEQNFLNSAKDVYYWIGLTRKYPMGTYKWQDDSAPTYTKWSPRNSALDECTHMKPLSIWSTESCFQHNNWICEKPQIC